MRRAATISILLLTLHSSPVLPQQAPTAGSIEGTVVRSDTGEPIAGARVSLASVDFALPGAPNVVATATDSTGEVVQIIGPVGEELLPGLVISNVVPAGSRPGSFQPVTTGTDGKFAFKELNAGTYRIAAAANGFVRQEYGQRALNGKGRPIFVTAGETVKDAAIRLAATGTVRGRVYDERGQPATNAPVQLLRANYNELGRTYQSVGTGNADDRGDYRVYGMPPGRYYLVAGAPFGLGGGGSPTSSRFTVAYYPNAADLDQASTVEVKAGVEVSFDMRVRRQSQTYRVRGRVVNSTGSTLPPNINLVLGYRTFTGWGSFPGGRSDPATGTFELQNVAPGDYTVQVQIPEQNSGPARGPIDAEAAVARQAALASRPFALAPIRVVDADIEGVVLNVTAGVTVAGRFVVEGLPISILPDIQRMRVAFVDDALRFLGTPFPVGLPAAADGTFQVQGLRDGEYRMTVNGPPPATSGFYVKSLHYGGDDILAKPLKFSSSGPGTFEVILRPGAAQVSGNVTDARSQPVSGIQVVLIPAQRNRTDLYRPGLTDQNGHFSLTGLTPGEYKLFSWEAIDGSFFDPELLKQYEQQGKVVQVAESSNQNVDVKLIPAQ